MSKDRQYKQELKKAKANLTDLRERGADAIGGSWEDLEKELFTPEEMAASDVRVAIISELIKARNEGKISQNELERLSGVKQSVISRMEKGTTSPQLDTVIKLLASLGKTLAVVPLEQVKEAS